MSSATKKKTVKSRADRPLSSLVLMVFLAIGLFLALPSFTLISSAQSVAGPGAAKILYSTASPSTGISVQDSQGAAGYVLSSSVSGSVTQVKGSWEVPGLSCTGISLESIDVAVTIDGRDGFMVESTCENGDVFYPASYISGGTSTSFSDVNPGDNLSMTVMYTNNGQFHMKFDDVTGGWAKTFTVSDPSAPRQAAIWTLGLIRSPLVDFSVASSGKVYTGSGGTDTAIIGGVSGTIGSFAKSSTVQVIQYNMVDSSNNPMATTSALAKGSSFVVNWVSST